MAEMSLQKQIARLLAPGQGFILMTFEFDGVTEPSVFTSADWNSTYYALQELKLFLENHFEVEKEEGTHGENGGG